MGTPTEKSKKLSILDEIFIKLLTVFKKINRNKRASTPYFFDHGFLIDMGKD